MSVHVIQPGGKVTLSGDGRDLGRGGGDGRKGDTAQLVAQDILGILRLILRVDISGPAAAMMITKAGHVRGLQVSRVGRFGDRE